VARNGSRPLFKCRHKRAASVRVKLKIESAMSVGISVKGVKPFDGTNFQGWKAQVSALFVMNDVLDIVDGTREEPSAGAGHAAALKKNVKDATARFIILSNLDEAQQVCVLSCISAKEMWDKLCLIHE